MRVPWRFRFRLRPAAPDLIAARFWRGKDSRKRAEKTQKRAEKCLKSAKKAQKRPKTLDFSLIFMF